MFKFLQKEEEGIISEEIIGNNEVLKKWEFGGDHDCVDNE